jgi:hypothetical protein
MQKPVEIAILCGAVHRSFRHVGWHDAFVCRKKTRSRILRV